MNNSLFNLIRSGGYILYAKHGEASVEVEQPDLNLQCCFTRRNLSEAGRRQVVNYGEALRTLRIPVSYPILVSHLCRAIETGQLAFGRDKIQADPFLFQIYKLSGNLSSTQQKKILNFLQSELEIKPPQGSNRVIIAHSFPKGIGLGEITDMGTVVIRPLGRDKGYEIVTKLSLEDLGNLAR